MSANLRFILLALTGAMILTACTTPASAPQTVGPATVSATTTSVEPPATTPSAVPSSSTPAPSTVIETTTSIPSEPTSSGATADNLPIALSAINIGIPESVLGESRTLAESAITNFKIAYQTSDAALAAPGAKDWTSDLSAYWAGTALENQLLSAEGFLRDGWHATGTRLINGEITSVSASDIQITACVNNSNYDILDAAGLSKKVLREPQVVLYEMTAATVGWQINNLTLPDPVRSC